MGLFDRFRVNNETETQEQKGSVIVDDVLLRALLSGEVITREKALTLPVISGAVDYISGTIASMPIKLYKYKKGKVEEVENDSRVRLLNGDTGDTLDGFQMKKAMIEDYLLGKGGYTVIQRQRNEVIALKYVENIYVTILKNVDPVNKFVRFNIGGKEYKNYELIKLLRNTKDGAEGKGVIDEISKALETAYSTLIYQLGLVKTGGNKKGFLQAERKLGLEEIKELKQAWKNLYQNNTESVVVLNNGLKFQESSNSSVEMQLNESKKTLQDEINNVFHISADFNKTFKEAIYPIIKAYESAINSVLLLESEKKNYFFEFDVKEIIKTNIKERYEAYKLAKECGIMTINEMRKAENMNYIEGMDVINLGLGSVLYNIETQTYYTPNTNQIVSTENENEDNGEGAKEKIEEEGGKENE